MNVCDTVYVRWYGSVVEGKLLDGEYLGMKQVQIPLDGRKPTALFTSNHIYQTAAEAAAKEVYSYPQSFPTPETIITKEPSTRLSDVMPADDREMLEKFKRENWDTERGHLRIDKLDEFYQLWRMVMRPFGYVDQAESTVAVDPDIVEVKEVENFSVTPKSNPIVTQLSLFN